MKNSLKTLVAALCLSTGIGLSCATTKQESINYPYENTNSRTELYESVKKTLEDIYVCEVAYFGKNCEYFDINSPEQLNDFCNIGYEDGDSFIKTFDITKEPFLTYDIEIDQKGGCKKEYPLSFEIYAKANLDSDSDLDIWKSWSIVGSNSDGYSKSPVHLQED